jgi:hypothetical protein
MVREVRRRGAPFAAARQPSPTRRGLALAGQTNESVQGLFRETNSLARGLL